MVGLVAAALLPGQALAGKKGARQDVEGHIAMQAPPSDATSNPNGCYSGVHRRFAILTQEKVNGVVGYHFDIDPATWNKKFRLTPVTEGVDIDITFYTEFGTLEQATDTAYAPHRGRVRQGSRRDEQSHRVHEGRIVCMKAGMDADFTYAAGKGVK
jgi:hypothetical protein